MQSAHTRIDKHEIDRAAFNAAFSDLGLRWRWDSRTYEALAAHDCERVRVNTYLQTQQPHLLRAYDADFLTDAILSAKERRRPAFEACGSKHAMPRFDAADVRSCEIGV